MRIVAVRSTAAETAEEQRALKMSAGMSTDRDYDVAVDALMYPWVLASFAHQTARAAVLPERVAGARMVWIDSGAFTQWAAGKPPLSVEAYADYLDELAQAIAAPLVTINMDVIPGGPGRPPTEEEVAAAVPASNENADYLRSRGFKVMEVWHRGENLAQLQHLLDRRQPGELVGLGGFVGMVPGAVARYLDPVFAHLTSHYPLDALPPIHGLGMSNRQTLWRYPMWSCDSSAWLAPGLYGRRMGKLGTTVHQGAETDRSRPRRFIECQKFLKTWLRWSAELSAAWEARGVGYADPPC